MRKIIDSARRVFVVIDIEEAKKRDMIFLFNIYGDVINILNCRSVWEDDQRRLWSVKQLNDEL